MRLDVSSTFPQPDRAYAGDMAVLRGHSIIHMGHRQLLHSPVPPWLLAILKNLGKFLTFPFNWAIGPWSQPQHNCSGPSNKGTVSVAGMTHAHCSIPQPWAGLVLGMVPASSARSLDILLPQPSP